MRSGTKLSRTCLTFACLEQNVDITFEKISVKSLKTEHIVQSWLDKALIKKAYTFWTKTHKKVVVPWDVQYDDSAEENKIVLKDQTMSSRNDFFENDSHTLNIFEDFTKNSTASPSFSSPNNADPF